MPTPTDTQVEIFYKSVVKIEEISRTLPSFIEKGQYIQAKASSMQMNKLANSLMKVLLGE